MHWSCWVTTCPIFDCNKLWQSIILIWFFVVSNLESVRRIHWLLVILTFHSNWTPLRKMYQRRSVFCDVYFIILGDGKCVICDSYVRPHVLVHVCDECNYGSFEVICRASEDSFNILYLGTLHYLWCARNF